MSFKIVFSIAKFCKTTKEVLFPFPVLPLVYLQPLKSVVAGWEYKNNELGCGKADERGIYGLDHSVSLLFLHGVVKHIFSQPLLSGTY